MFNYENIGIGLITHTKSKYLNSDGEHELFNNLRDSLGLDIRNIQITKIDKYEISSIDLGIRNFLLGILIFSKSIFETQIHIIKKSSKFTLSRIIRNLVSGVYSILNLVNLYFLFKITNKKYKKYYYCTKRQADISESHLEILTKLNRSYLNWIIILEDDIKLNPEIDINNYLNKLLSKIQSISEVKIVNLSESFSDLDLGIEGLVNEKIEINNDNLTKIKIYEYPVTNTVCATAYRVSALDQIITELKKLQDILFIPIDHKLNIVLHGLLRMKVIRTAAYASVEPGFFIQRSLHE